MTIEFFTAHADTIFIVGFIKAILFAAYWKFIRPLIREGKETEARKAAERTRRHERSCAHFEKIEDSIQDLRKDFVAKEAEVVKQLGYLTKSLDTVKPKVERLQLDMVRCMTMLEVGKDEKVNTAKD